jgi:PEP-CTERM motif
VPNRHIHHIGLLILGTLVFSSSPDAVNEAASLSAMGTVSLPGSGSVSITSTSLAVGTYTAAIEGSEHVFLNVLGIPEPSSCSMMGSGFVAALGIALRNNRRRPAA